MLIFEFLQYPSDSDWESNYAKADRETFEAYREAIGDVFGSCYVFLGDECVNQLFEVVSNDWQSIEMALFAFLSFVDYVKATSESVRNFVQSLPQLPVLNVRVANTLLSVITRSSHIISACKLYSAVLPLVIRYLNEPQTSLNATMALKDLTHERDEELLPMSDTLIQALKLVFQFVLFDQIKFASFFVSKLCSLILD